MAGSCLTEKSVCGSLLEIFLACVLTLDGNPALRTLEYLVSAQARFHPDKAGRQYFEEDQQAMAPDVSLENEMSGGGGAAPLENRFGKITANSSISGADNRSRRMSDTSHEEAGEHQFLHQLPGHNQTLESGSKVLSVTTIPFTPT